MRCFAPIALNLHPWQEPEAVEGSEVLEALERGVGVQFQAVRSLEGFPRVWRSCFFLFRFRVYGGFWHCRDLTRR